MWNFHLIQKAATILPYTTTFSETLCRHTLSRVLDKGQNSKPSPHEHSWAFIEDLLFSLGLTVGRSLTPGVRMLVCLDLIELWLLVLCLREDLRSLFLSPIVVEPGPSGYSPLELWMS